MRFKSESVGFGSRGLRGVLRCAAVCVALLTVFVMGVPVVWGADGVGPVVALHDDEKTNVQFDGDAATYQLGNVTVTGMDSCYFSVTVDTGSFTLPDTVAPANASAFGALDAQSAYVQGTDMKAKGEYKYVSYKSSGNNITAQDLQAFLRELTFTLDDDQSQSVSVAAVNTTLSATATATTTEGQASRKTSDVILFNGHAYAFFPFEAYATGALKSSGCTDWPEAYAAAKKSTFMGAKGHLLTIESEEENNLIYKSFNNKTGWLGATRFTTAEQAKANADTFTLNIAGRYPTKEEDAQYLAWYWVTGPSAGVKFWDGGYAPENTSRQPTARLGNAVKGVYANWAKDEPDDDYFDQGTRKSIEYLATYGADGKWNDSVGMNLIWETQSSPTDVQGYYVEYDTGLNLGSGYAVSSTPVKRVESEIDQDGGLLKVSKKSSSSAKAASDSSDSSDSSAVSAASVQAAGLRSAGASVRAVANKTVSSEHLLTGTKYELTLSAADGRQLDTDTVSVKVGGKSLDEGEDFSFDKSSGELTIPAKSVTASVSIEAKVKRQVTVTDDKNKTLGSTSVSYNKALDKSEIDSVAKKTGYTVSGYTNAADNSSFNLATQVSDDMTLAAQYKLNDPTVTFTQDKTKLETRADKVTMSVKSVKPLSSVSETITWSKDGKTVGVCANKSTCAVGEAGSYTVTVAEDDHDGHTSSVTKTVSIEAPSNREVTVNTSDTASKKVTVVNGDPLGANNVAGTSKQGYTLSGWTTSDGQSFDPVSTPVLSDLTVSPVWTLNQAQVDVSSSSATVAPGESAKIETNVTTPSVENGSVTTDYKWYKDGSIIDGANSADYEVSEPGTYKVEVTVTDPTTNKSSTTSKEITVRAPSHTVTIDNGNGSSTTVTVPDGETIDTSKLPQPKKDGYEFTGWAKADGTPFDPSKDKLLDDMAIHPVWKLLEPEVDVTVDGNSVNTKVNNPAGATVEYQWYKDGELLAGQTGENLTNAKPGVYTVKITLTDADGNTVTVEKTVTVEDTSAFGLGRSANGHNTNAQNAASGHALASTGTVLLPAALVLAITLLAALALFALARRLS